MDGGNRLNILYADTLDMMKIPRRSLHPSAVSFNGVGSSKQAYLE
jgi:hypothetical protein